MTWVLVLILIGRLSGSTNGIAAVSFGSQEACHSLVQALTVWNNEAAMMYPTDTPYVYAYCAPVTQTDAPTETGR